MDVFSAGIVWDPREPLPPEYSARDGPAIVSKLAIESTGSNALYLHSAHYPGATQQPTHGTILPRNVVQEQDRNVLPAISVSINVQITGDVAEVTARQLFWNDANVPIHQGCYTFALPTGCTVTGFNCRIGKKRVLRAKACPKGEAREAFQRAVASHATAALLEQNTPEIFTASLGNIPPDTRMKTEITYVAILKRRFIENKNITTLVIPTYIANRYGQRPVDLQGLDLESQAGNISLRIEIFESEQIHSIGSESHEILVERGAQIGQALTWDDVGKSPKETKHESAIVTIQEATSWLNTDFVLTIDTACTKDNDTPHAWLELHPSFANHAAMMVTLPPRMLLFQDETPKIGEILFMVDRSGSMTDKMENLRSAMHFFLKGIPLGRTFNIWSFGSSYESLWAKSQVYGQESLHAALNYVNTKFRADMGGTELLAALQAIISARDPSLPCDVVILTDGEVWRLDETLRLVGKAHESSNGAVRFFSLGIGAHVSHALVEGIAQQGGGYSEVIPPFARDGWEERLVVMLKAALTNHVRDLRFDIGTLKAMTSPPDLGSLNPFRAQRIFLLLEQGTTSENDIITVTSISGGKRTSFDISKVKLEKPGTLIHSLSVQAILGDVERGLFSQSPYAPQAYQRPEEEEAGLSHIAGKLACKYSLPSRWTSLFLLQQDNEASEGQTAPGSLTEITISRIEARLLQARRTSDTCNRYMIAGPVPPEAPHPGPPRGFPNQSQIHFPSPPPAPSQMLSGPRRPSHFGPPTPSPSPHHSPFQFELSAEKQFVSVILGNQAFDGSIADGIINELPEMAQTVINGLKNWVRERTGLNGLELDLVANTAVIIAFLERNYKKTKDLWGMIREKALQYILQQVSSPAMRNGILGYARKELKVLSDPAHFERKPLSPLAVRQLGGERTNVATVIEDLGGSDRVLVHRAPID